MRLVIALCALLAIAIPAAAQTGGAFLLRGSNLADVPNKATARTNLQTLGIANNLSDVSNTATARSNLGITAPNTPYTPPFTNAATETVSSRLAQAIYVTDFTGVDKTGVSNSCTGVQNAINYGHNTLNGGRIIFPAGTYTLTSCALIVYSNMTFEGDGPFATFLSFFSGSSGGITISATSSNVQFRNLALYGPLQPGGGGASTAAGITGTDVNYVVFEDVRVMYFDIGIQLNRGVGAASPFSNQIVRAYVASNTTTNIDLNDNANAIGIYDTVVSGLPLYGVRSRGNGSVSVIGGVCQGASISCYEIDTTVAGPTAHNIIGVHIENSASTGGQIRLGNTAQVQGINIIGNAFSGNGVTDLTPINAIRVDGLHISGNALASGGGQYTGSADVTYGTVSNVSVIGNSGFEQRLSPTSGKPRYSTVPIGSVAYSTFGTEINPVSGNLFFTSIVIERDMTLTGIAVLNGATVGTNKQIVAIYDSAGNRLATSALAGVTTAGANDFQQIPFTAPLAVYGPRRYWVAVMSDGNTDTRRDVSASTFIDVFANSVAGTFGTIPATITPASSMAALNAAIAYVY